jgi:hypothetical protein
MPAVYDEKLWLALYGRIDDDGVITHYGKEWVERRNNNTFERRLAYLENLGIDGYVLVVGSAFGYLLTMLQHAGIDAWGIDSSPWVWDEANKDQWARGTRERTAQAAVGSGFEAAALQSIGAPAVFDWVIDEDAACAHGVVDQFRNSDRYQPSEISTFIDGCEVLCVDPNQIVHIVTIRELPGDTALTWLSLEEWQAFAPAHAWVDSMYAQ